MRTLRIGTRASALARWQAETVRAQLSQAGETCDLVLIRTAGDADRETPLSAMGGKGIFIKELEEALLDNRVDLAVHSMKDVPTELPAGLLISAICRRHDVRDVLVSRDGLGLDQLPVGARVGSSSLRRQAQLRRHRADLEMVEIRGNVDTRLAKVERGEYDATVLAKAGLDRLGLADRISEVLSTEICLPAAGQGAIGVESRGSDEEVLAVLRGLDDRNARIAVETERMVLADLEGGCQLPLGVWARIEEGKLVIDACVVAVDGSEAIRVRRSGSPQDARNLGHEVSAALLGQGAGRLLHSGAENMRGSAGGQ